MDKTTSRLRVAHIIVQASLVWDDGDELFDESELQPVKLRLSDLPEYASGLIEAVKRIEEDTLKEKEKED